MSGYTADLGLLDFDAELGATAKKKKKKKKFGAKLKKGLKKLGKGIAVVSTGGLALAAMKPGKKLLAKAKKSKIGKKVLGGAKALGLQSKAKKLVKAKTVKKAVVAKKALSKGACPAAAKTIAKVTSATASDCASKSDLAKLVAAQLAAQLSPGLNEANTLLAKMDLQRTATAEHKKLMSEADFRREVLSLLALKAANGNRACQNAVGVIMRGRG